MKLYYSPTSPYARKARVLILEKDLAVHAEPQSPFEESPELVAANPLRRVPVLVRDEGSALVDSPLICAYLDALTPEPRLIPQGEDQWSVRLGEALADGILDAAFALVMERKRPPEQQSPMWMERWQTAIYRTLARLEQDKALRAAPLNLAQIALACALEYLDFRLDDLKWRNPCPRLDAWLGDFAQRPSLIATRPG